MRRLQTEIETFRKRAALYISLAAFTILWAGGALIFWATEESGQGWSFFRSLYFSYVALLTIGFGDMAPKSNFGRPFFVIWSLVAIPTMTLLIGNLGDTVVASFQRYTDAFADYTLLPKDGIWRAMLERNPRLASWLQSRKERKDAEKRKKQKVDNDAAGVSESPSKDNLTDEDLMRCLVRAIQRTTRDARKDPGKQYSYEDWVDFRRLIRFTAGNEQSVAEWDWDRDDSPMLTQGSEVDFVVDRLCESLARGVRQFGVPLADETPATAGPSEGRA